MISSIVASGCDQTLPVSARDEGGEILGWVDIEGAIIPMAFWEWISPDSEGEGSFVRRLPERRWHVIGRAQGLQGALLHTPDPTQYLSFQCDTAGELFFVTRPHWPASNFSSNFRSEGRRRADRPTLIEMEVEVLRVCSLDIEATFFSITRTGKGSSCRS